MYAIVCRYRQKPRITFAPENWTRATYSERFNSLECIGRRQLRASLTGHSDSDDSATGWIAS